MKVNLKRNSIMKFIKNCDYFGVYLNFQFKERLKYRSMYGGVMFMVFFIFSVFYVFANFNNFAQRKQINLIYHEGVLEKAPPLNFANYSIGIAIGVSSSNDSQGATSSGDSQFSLLYDNLELEFNAVVLKKEDGRIIKIKTNYPLEKCQKHHFYNQVDTMFNELQLSNYFCPNISDFNISGIYIEENFNYFEYLVKIKDKALLDPNNFKSILEDNYVKAQVFYLDIAVDIYDYENPIKRFINEDFSVLDFAFYKKTNIDFMPTNFISDANIIFTTNNVDNYMVLTDKYEYFNYKGDNRLLNQPRDWNILNKIYLRSSIKMRLTKRVYMKITEYLANMSSILSSILLILIILMNYINRIKARTSIIKNILKFKDDKFYQRDESIKYFREKFKNDKVDIESNLDLNTDPGERKNNIKNIYNMKNEIIYACNSENSFSYRVNKENVNINYEDIYTNYCSSRKLNDNQDANYQKIESDRRSNGISNFNIYGNDAIVTSKHLKRNTHIDSQIKSKFKDNYYRANNFDDFNKDKIILTAPNRRKAMTNVKFILPKYKLRSRTISLNNKRFGKKDMSKITMNFNLKELFLKYFCFCCHNKKMKIKLELQNRGNDIFNYQMNIMTYLRKMQEIDILKLLIFSDDQINLFNFIAKPSISLGSHNQIIENMYNKLNNKTTKDEINKLFNSFNILFNKGREQQTELDKKMLNMVSSEIDNLLD